jgi:hypothetical protein
MLKLRYCKTASDNNNFLALLNKEQISKLSNEASILQSDFSQFHEDFQKVKGSIIVASQQLWGDGL